VTIDTQMESLSSWRQRLQPRVGGKWNASSARKKNTTNTDQHAKDSLKYQRGELDVSIESECSEIIFDVPTNIKTMKTTTNINSTANTKGDVTEDSAVAEEMEADSIEVDNVVTFDDLSDLEKTLFLKLNDANQKAVEQATQELCNLTDGNEEICERLYRFGGYGILLATMTKFPYNAIVQGNCVIVFANVVSEIKRCRDALAATSILYIVTQAMQRFPSHLLVQQMSLKFLWTFLDADGTKRTFVEELKGIELVTAAMACFIDDASVQKQGCQVLLKLSFSKGSTEHLKASSAVICVAAALRHYPEECEEPADAFMTSMFKVSIIHFRRPRSSVWLQRLKNRVGL